MSQYITGIASLEPPKELLFTARCNRHLAGNGWRVIDINVGWPAEDDPE